MRISDWSSDVCYSELGIYLPFAVQALEQTAPSIALRSMYLPPREMEEAMAAGDVDIACGYFPDITSNQFLHLRIGLHSFACIVRAGHPLRNREIGRASCRERVCQYV